MDQLALISKIRIHPKTRLKCLVLNHEIRQMPFKYRTQGSGFWFICSFLVWISSDWSETGRLCPVFKCTMAKIPNIFQPDTHSSCEYSFTLSLKFDFFSWKNTRGQWVLEVLDEDPLRQVESTLLQRQMEHQPRQEDQESSINEFLRFSIHRLTGIRGLSNIDGCRGKCN